MLRLVSRLHKFCSGGIGRLITSDKIHSLPFKKIFKPISFEACEFSSIEKFSQLRFHMRLWYALWSKSFWECWQVCPSFRISQICVVCLSKFSLPQPMHLMTNHGCLSLFQIPTRLWQSSYYCDYHSVIARHEQRKEMSVLKAEVIVKWLILLNFNIKSILSWIDLVFV